MWHTLQRFGEWGISLKNEANFTLLKRRLLIQLIQGLVVSVVVLLFLFSLFSGVVAEWVLQFFQTKLSLDYESAFTIYHRAIRQNKIEIISLLMIGAIYFIFRQLINTVMTYFNEIDDNLKTIVTESDTLTELSPELSSISVKINQSKQIINHREMALKDSEMKKNDLVVYLAHDIKTPLTSIIGYLSFLVEAEEIDELVRQKYLALVLTKANDLEGLINEFFDITRFNMQDIVLTKQQADLKLMLQQIVDERSFEMEAKGQWAEMEAESLLISVDLEKFARVLNNLVKNAILYGDDHSPINIKTKDTALGVTLTIANASDTLSEEAMATMFDKFIRLNRARTTNNGGAGLGLAISKDIVEAHDGQIAVASRDRVTTFTIFLPKI